jgi:hypothetical protein
VSKTESESLFELLCAAKDVPCERVPEGATSTHDYNLTLDSGVVATEVKQIDPNDADEARNKPENRNLEAGAPVDRVRKLISKAYRQLKVPMRAQVPCLLVLYNNAGLVNWIDGFTVTTAMFGRFAFDLALCTDGVMRVAGHGFRGGRKMTSNSCRGLSAVAVLEREGRGRVTLTAYHNPFATVPLASTQLAELAEEQYRHDGPHGRGFVRFAPSMIEIR